MEFKARRGILGAAFAERLATMGVEAAAAQTKRQSCWRGIQARLWAMKKLHQREACGFSRATMARLFLRRPAGDRPRRVPGAGRRSRRPKPRNWQRLRPPPARPAPARPLRHRPFRRAFSNREGSLERHPVHAPMEWRRAPLQQSDRIAFAWLIAASPFHFGWGCWFSFWIHCSLGSSPPLLPSTESRKAQAKRRAPRPFPTLRARENNEGSA